MKKKISLEKFEGKTLEKEQLFHVLGGAAFFNTKSNGHTTKSAGDDSDTETSDSDERPNEEA
ncbi:hypothetical protein DBR43_30325 [Pedobacter sp. KBW06]|uniref:hypothetical protein n=1 Tax=Pedobacter sp. KBW06 TaxID=2153359 RepID=UPI000F59AF3B|nr:hypothetical protein [Pedobacter sp. KBW06]RQO65156.1 hypothetical protein DBR43_30325 [Pedobacter sp. KBW06]